MIKKILSLALIFSSIITSAQSFTATYDFSLASTTSGTMDPTPAPIVTGLTCGSFIAVGTPSANPNAGGRFSFVGWPTGATTTVDTYSTMTGSLNTNEYYEVTLTPQAGYTVTYNSIAFTVQRSGSGIRNYAVRSSADGFTNNLPAAVLTGTNLSVVGTNEFFWNFDALTSAQNGSSINLLGATTTASVSFRFYGWNSEALSGTFSIDNVVFNGSTDDGICSSPTITTISSNSPICANQTLNLQSTVLGDSPITYTWTGAGSFGSANSANTTVTGATSTEYTLSVTNVCGTATAVITPTVNSLPIISVNSESICSGSSATLTANGALTYTWSTSDINPSIVVTPTISSQYTVSGSDFNGCTNTAVASVTVNSLPTISVNSESICVASSATLTANGALTYTWSTSDINPSIVVTPTTSIAQYTVTGTDINSCENMAVATVTVNSLPIVTLDLSTINLQCVTINSVTLVGENPSGGIYSGTAVTSGVFSPSAVGIGTYTITYTFTDGNNCSASASDNIVVDACTGIVSLNLESFNIYPNPNNGSLTIKSPVFPANVNVFDINGKHVISQNITSFETLIDLSNVINGVYQLNIVTDQQSFNYKIMINK